jgi:hypothetical protein
LQKKLNANLEQTIKVIAIVLPILWVFVISQIFVSALGDKVAVDTPDTSKPKHRP